MTGKPCPHQSLDPEWIALAEAIGRGLARAQHATEARHPKVAEPAARSKMGAVRDSEEMTDGRR